jgi:hypothetical protein
MRESRKTAHAPGRAASRSCLGAPRLANRGPISESGVARLKSRRWSEQRRLNRNHQMGPGVAANLTVRRSNNESAPETVNCG